MSRQTDSLTSGTTHSARTTCEGPALATATVDPDVLDTEGNNAWVRDPSAPNTSKTARHSIRLMLFNVRGINNKEKRTTFKMWARDHADIVIFTETHLDNSKWVSVMRAFGPEDCSAWTTRGTGASCGVGVVALNRRYTITKLWEDQFGRILDVRIIDSHTQSSKKVRAVYAPSESPTARNAFFEEQLVELLDESNTFDIIAGDWNCCASPKDTNQKDYKPDTSALRLEETMASLQMQDAGLTQQSWPDITWQRLANAGDPTSLPARRLDRYYVHQTGLLSITNVSVLTPPPAGPNRSYDHRPVILTLSETRSDRGRGLWKADPKLFLHDKLKHRLANIMHRFTGADIQPIQSWLCAKHLATTATQQYQMYHQPTPQHVLSYKIYADMQRHPEIFTEDERRTSATRFYEDLELSCEIATLKGRSAADTMAEMPCAATKRALDGRRAVIELREVYGDDSKSFTVTGSAMTVPFADFYRRLYSRRPRDRGKLARLLASWKVDPAEWNSMLPDFSMQELTEALKKCDPNKSPGPDGLGYNLYIQVPETHQPLLAAINHIWRKDDSVPSDWLQAVIVTLYKGKGDLKDIANRRPLTLLNCDYKIMAKMVAARLQPILMRIISKAQNGFVKGRSIHDNIFILDEVIRAAVQDDDDTVLIALLDFTKAFDMVQHDAIEEILQHLSCPPRVISFLMTVLRGRAARVLVNGFLSQELQIQCGTGQGDPLSALLFVLAVEPLSRSIQSDPICTGVTISGRKSTSPVQVRILLLADDTTTIADSVTSFRAQQQHVHDYCAATGMEISEQKSSLITPNGVPAQDPTDPTKQLTLPYPRANAVTGERLLGLWFNDKGIVPRRPQVAIEIAAKLAKWGSYRATVAGKAAVIRVFGFSRLIYLFPEPLQLQVDQELLQAFQRFIWRKPAWDPTQPAPKPHVRVCYERLMQPMESDMGGVNLIHPHKYHQAQKAAHLSKVLANSACLYHDSWREQLREARRGCDFLIPEDRARAAKNLREIRATQALTDAFNCATLAPFLRAGIDCFSHKYDVKTLYNILIVFDCPDRTVAMKKEEEDHNFSRKRAFTNLRSTPLTKRVFGTVWSAWMKALPKIYGPDADSCSRCQLAPQEHDANQEHERSAHLFFECGDTQELAKQINNELERRYNLGFAWSSLRFYTLDGSRHKSSSKFYRTVYAIFIYTTWIHRNEATHRYDQWVTDWDYKAATALFFSELQRSANLCWYRLQMQKHQLTASEWIQKKQDFEDIWNIGTLFKVQYGSVVYF